jgi:hypothetical protein
MLITSNSSGVEFVRLTTEQQDRILGGTEHPAIQIETAMEGPKVVEPPLQQTCSRCLAQKKLKAFNLRLADPQNRLFVVPERERSPHNEVLFPSREFFVPALSLAAWSTLRSRSKRRWRGQGPSSPRCSRPARDASPKES